MHNYGVDVLLLNFVRDKCQDAVLATQIFQLLVHIASWKSSIDLVYGLVTLDSFSDLALESIRELLFRGQMIPGCSIPINVKTRITVVGMTSQCFKTDFAFAFWIFLAFPLGEQPVPILTVTTADGSRLAVHVQRQTLWIYCHGVARQWNGNIPDAIPHDSWCLVSISFRMDSGNLTATVSVNGWEMRHLMFPQFDVCEGSLTVSVGGSLKDIQSDWTIQPQLGSFGFYPKFNRSIRLFEFGPRRIPYFLNPFLFARATVQAGQLCLESYPSADLKALVHRPAFKLATSFEYVLLEKCRFSLFLPRFVNGDIETLTEILIQLAELQNRRQRPFMKSKDFPILSHLLMIAERSLLTDSLFQKFAFLMDFLEDQQLLRHILLNLSIWSQVGAKAPRILGDLLHVVIPNHIERILVYWRPSFVLMLIQVYYDVSLAMPSSIDEASDLAIRENRHVMFRILQLICRFQFDSDFIPTFVAWMLNYRDFGNLADHFDFLRRLTLDDQIQKGESMRDVCSLKSVLLSGSPLAIVKYIGLLDCLHWKALIRELTFDEHLSMMLRTEKVEPGLFHSTEGVQLLTHLLRESRGRTMSLCA
jgi:hypothetical protein